MQSAQKITNAGSRVYDRSRVPTDWLKVNGEKRRRRRRRRRRRNKRKESDERRDVENRLNVALTSIGEPERAVVRVHSCPFLPGFQLFQKFKRSRDDDFFSSSALLLLLLLLRRRAPTSSKHDDADSLSFASLTSSWESRRRKWRRRLQKDGREVRTLNITFIDFRVKLKAFRATSSMSSSSSSSLQHYSLPTSLLLATMMSLVLLEYLTRVSVRGSDADPDAKRGHRCARGRPSTHQQRHRRPSNRTIHDASQRHVDGGFPFRVQLKFRCAMMWWCFVLSWRCRRRRCLRLLCRRVLSHDDDDDDGVSSSLSSSSSSSSSLAPFVCSLCIKPKSIHE